MGSANWHIVLQHVRVMLGLALWFAPASGATLELLSLNDLVGKSSAIVEAQVTGSAASYSGSVIYTHYQMGVLAQWKGVGQAAIDVLVPGGTANGMRQTYPGAPQLIVGQRYVLFLWTSNKGATYTLGLTQGVFSLLTDSSGNVSAVQMATTETILSPGTGQAVKNQPIGMPLPQLISAIAAGAH